MDSFYGDEEKVDIANSLSLIYHIVGLGLLSYVIIKELTKPKGGDFDIEAFKRTVPTTEVTTEKTVKTYGEPTPVLKGFDIDPYKGMTIPSGAYGMYKVEEMLMRKIKKHPF